VSSAPSFVFEQAFRRFASSPRPFTARRSAPPRLLHRRGPAHLPGLVHRDVRATFAALSPRGADRLAIDKIRFSLRHVMCRRIIYGEHSQLSPLMVRFLAYHATSSLLSSHVSRAARRYMMRRPTRVAGGPILSNRQRTRVRAHLPRNAAASCSVK
jgi:hypothetical protein